MGVARLYRTGSPYNGVDVPEVDFEQSADTMYMAHLNYPPHKLLRFGHANWSFQPVTFGPRIAAPASVTAVASNPNTDSGNGGAAYFPQSDAYVVTSVVDATGQESRVSNNPNAINDLTLKGNVNTINWTARAGVDRYRIYKSHVTSGFGYIGTTTTTTFVDDNIGPDLSEGPLNGDNPFAAVGDYPSTVTFFEQRLMWARTLNRPNAIWGSRSGDYENMDISRPLRPNDALSFALVAGRVNAVNQLASVSQLLALSSDSIFRVDGGGENGYLSPTSIVSRRQLGRGSSRLGPLVIDNVVFYKPSVGSAIRSIGYTFELDGYQSNDISIYSPHFFDGFNITSWAYAQEPRSVIWAVRDDGKLLCFTWEQEQQVWGWTICETDGRVDSVCTISERGEDRLYLTIWREVQGVQRLYIERMAATRWANQADCCFLDCAKTFQFETPVRLLTGLHHLEGCTVKALADANVVSGLVVQDGRVTLPYGARTVTVGLPFETTIETLPLSVASQGTNQGKRQQVGEVVIRVIDSRGVQAGPNEANLFRIKPRSNEEFGAPNRLLSGDYRTDMAPVVSGKASVLIRSTDPLPLTVTAIFLDPIVGDG